ncbi:MAG TPA: hypothetical protein VGW34_03900 [Allosphingosinicella sp.]|nr:hypothetical protein [Allosphingosinicella sp.]
MQRTAANARLAKTLAALCVRAMLASLPGAALLVAGLGTGLGSAVREILLLALIMGTPAFIVAAILLGESRAAAARTWAAGLPLVMGVAVVVGGRL